MPGVAARAPYFVSAEPAQAPRRRPKRHRALIRRTIVFLLRLRDLLDATRAPESVALSHPYAALPKSPRILRRWLAQIRQGWGRALNFGRGAWRSRTCAVFCQRRASPGATAQTKKASRIKSSHHCFLLRLRDLLDATRAPESVALSHPYAALPKSPGFAAAGGGCWPRQKLWTRAA